VPNPGEWGNNLRIDVDYRTADPATQFNLVVSEVREADGIATASRTEIFRNLTMSAGPRNAIDVVNAESRLVTLDQDAGFGNDRPAPTGYYSDVIPVANLAGLTGSADIDVDFGTGVETVTVDY